MIANASTAAPPTVPTIGDSAAASGMWNSFNIATIATQANIDSTSVTNPRISPSAADPATAIRTTMSRAVRFMRSGIGTRAANR
jgi:hypothetical protein